MATQNAAQIGFIVGFQQSSQATARDTTGGFPTNSPSGNGAINIQYFQSSGRGGGTFRYTRTFLRFDTSDISGASSFTLKTACSVGTTATETVFAVKSDAFTGEDTTLASADFNNLDFSTLYSSNATGNTFANSNSGTNDIALSSTAANDINNNSVFTVALVTRLDYNDSDLEADGAVNHKINFNTIPFLDFTPAASGYGNQVNTVAPSNIAIINNVATANIEKINTI